MEEQNVKTVETIQAEMIELHKKISESDEKIIGYLKSMIQDLKEVNDLQKQIIHL